MLYRAKFVLLLNLFKRCLKACCDIRNMWNSHPQNILLHTFRCFLKRIQLRMPFAWNSTPFYPIFNPFPALWQVLHWSHPRIGRGARVLWPNVGDLPFQRGPDHAADLCDAPPGSRLQGKCDAMWVAMVIRFFGGWMGYLVGCIRDLVT